MADRKLKAAFDRMEAPRLRAVLNGICEHFARNKHAGTIYYVDGKIVLTTESGNRVFQDAFAVREQGNDEQNGSQKDGKGKLEKKKDNIGGAEGVHTANSSSNVMKRKREDTPENKTNQKEIQGEEEGSEEDSDNSDCWDDVPALSESQIRGLIASGRGRKAGCGITSKNFSIFECENCHNDFDIEKNNKGDCVCHPGEIREDEELDRYGRRSEFLEHDPAYAHLFTWTCCESQIDAECCLSTRHKVPVPQERIHKRARY